MLATSSLGSRPLRIAAALLAVGAIAAGMAVGARCAFADGALSPVVVLKDPIPGDMPSINPPARVVVYNSGLVVYRPEHSRPITAESTTVEYRSMQLSPTAYALLMHSLPLKQAYLQWRWVDYMMPQIITFDHGARRVGVEAANFTQLYAQPSAQARYTVYRILSGLRSPNASVYTAPTYTLRLYPTTPKYSPGPAAVWPGGWGDIALPSDAVHGAPRTDRRYCVKISGAQFNRIQTLLGTSDDQRGLVTIDGKLWLLEFTPHLPDEAAWGGDERGDFLITRDAIHGDIPNDYSDW